MLSDIFQSVNFCSHKHAKIYVYWDILEHLCMNCQFSNVLFRFPTESEMFMVSEG